MSLYRALDALDTPLFFWIQGKRPTLGHILKASQLPIYKKRAEFALRPFWKSRLLLIANQPQY